jgi:hypothetical protein
MAQNESNPSQVTSNQENEFRKTDWQSVLQWLLQVVPALGLFTGLLVFVGRLYVESYYSYLGIPPSALEFAIQDYTFGSFPLVLFVLVVTGIVTSYWIAFQIGRFKFGCVGGLLLRLIKKCNGHCQDAIEKGSDLISSPDDKRKGFLKSLDVALLFVLLILAIPLLIPFMFICLAISILGPELSLTLLGLDEWRLLNIPSLRGFLSGLLLTLVSLIVIAIFEMFIPSNDVRKWIPPIVMVLAIVLGMPVVTFYMARGQAHADLNAQMNVYQSSLPVAVFESARSLGNGRAWSGDCQSPNTGDHPCSSPRFKVILINNGIAYVLPEKPDVGNEFHELHTIMLEDVEHIRYLSPVRK